MGPRDRSSTHLHEAVTAVTAVTGELDASLARLRERRLQIEFEVPALRATLWLVANDHESQALIGQGIEAGRIWTLSHMADLLKAPGTHEDAVAVARVKLAFNAELVEVRSSDGAAEAPEPDVSPEPEQTTLDLGSTNREFD